MSINAEVNNFFIPMLFKGRVFQLVGPL